jgi:hypothetical protein
MQTVYFYASLVACTVFAAVLGINYFILYPIPGFFIKLIELAVASLITLCAFAAGRKAFRHIRLPVSSYLEESIFSMGLGYGLLILFTFLLGISGLYFSPVFWAFLLGAVILCRRELYEFHEKMRQYFLDISIKGISLHGVLYSVLFSLLFMLIAITCFAPPSYYDSLVYHMALPGIYAAAKKICFVPFNLYSNFPQNMEMLYTMGLVLCDEIVPNLISFSMFVVTLAAIYSFCRRFTDKSVSLFAVLIYMTTPAVMLLAPSSYVEAGLAMFTVMAVYSYCIYHREGITDYLVLSGVFSGLAFGTKYTAAAVPLTISLVLLTRCVMRKELKYLKQILILNITVLVVASPWLIKNFVNVGNPVFPFLYNLLGYKAVDWNFSTAHNYFTMLTEYGHKGNIIGEFFSVPWNVLKDPVKFGGGFDILGNFGWVTYFMLLPMLLLVQKGNVIKLLCFFSGIYAITWFVSKPVLRFLLPLLPVLAVLCSYVAVNVYRKKLLVLRYVLLPGFALLALSNIFIYFFIQDTIEPFNVSIGIEARDSYLARKIRYSPYPVFEYINSNLSDSDTVLFIGEQRGFYCRKKYIAANVFARNPFVSWANEARNCDDLILYMKKRNITHILYNRGE